MGIRGRKPLVLTLEQMKDLSSRKVSPSEMAGRLGVSYHTVIRVMKRAGVHLKVGRSPLLLTHAQIAQFEKGKMSVSEFARRIGKPYAATRLALMRAGAPIKAGRPVKNTMRDLAIVALVIKKGKPYKEISEIYHITPQRISSILRRHLMQEKRA